MQKESDLNLLVKQGFSDLFSELDSSQKKYLNPQSLENFIYHLIDEPKINSNKNRKLQELGEERMKKRLLDFYSDARNSKLDKNLSIELYKKHIYYIGSFMSKHYGFSATGGKIVFFAILIVLTIGVTLDTILNLSGLVKFPFSTIFLLLIFFLRRFNKIRSKKLFGLYY